MKLKLNTVLSLFLLFQGYFTLAATDALDEVNQYRATKGLPPFQRDEKLSQAAAACADYRAAKLIEGHVFENGRTDYSFLPAGAQAAATGCAAWTPDWGWGSCCSEEKWTYAGAAYTFGRDGQRYMHLFVNNSPNSPAEPQYSWRRTDKDSGWWYMKGSKYVGFLNDERLFRWRNEDGSYSEGQLLEAGSFPKK
jgi:hypothetical protein